LALMLLVDSRRSTRTTEQGELVPLAEQDRGRWDRALVAEGRSLVRECLRGNRPGPYQIQAAIQAVHADARSTEETDWRQIVALYDHLLELDPGPIVRLNRAVAVAEVEGPLAGLALVDALELGTYPLFHAIRADLLRRLGRESEAATAYDVALELTENAAERAHLRRRRSSLAP